MIISVVSPIDKISKKRNNGQTGFEQRISEFKSNCFTNCVIAHCCDCSNLINGVYNLSWIECHCVFDWYKMTDKNILEKKVLL